MACVIAKLITITQGPGPYCIPSISTVAYLITTRLRKPTCLFSFRLLGVKERLEVEKASMFQPCSHWRKLYTRTREHTMYSVYSQSPSAVTMAGEPIQVDFQAL